MCTRKKLCNIKGLSDAKVDKIKEACAKLNEYCFLTALQVCGKRKNVFRVTTGSEELKYVQVILFYFLLYLFP